LYGKYSEDLAREATALSPIADRYCSLLIQLLEEENKEQAGLGIEKNEEKPHHENQPLRKEANNYNPYEGWSMWSGMTNTEQTEARKGDEKEKEKEEREKEREENDDERDRHSKDETSHPTSKKRVLLLTAVYKAQESNRVLRKEAKKRKAALGGIYVAADAAVKANANLNRLVDDFIPPHSSVTSARSALLVLSFTRKDISKNIQEEYVTLREIFYQSNERLKALVTKFSNFEVHTITVNNLHSLFLVLDITNERADVIKYYRRGSFYRYTGCFRYSQIYFEG
jgi:hypothetical protein